jgi:hypothetical protein
LLDNLVFVRPVSAAKRGAVDRHGYASAP